MTALLLDIVKSNVDVVLFFFNDTATTEIYTLSLHDALPSCDFTRPGALGTVSLHPFASGYTAVIGKYVAASEKIGRAHV